MRFPLGDCRPAASDQGMETHKTRESEREGSTVKTADKADGHAHAPAADPTPVTPPAERDPEPVKEARGDKAGTPRKKTQKNNVRKMRTEKMMSKAELARRAGMSTL